jgi:hypothetical protein
VVGSVTPGTTGHSNRYLARVPGNAAACAGHTGPFLEERHQRIAAPPGSQAPAPALLKTRELPHPGQVVGMSWAVGCLDHADLSATDTSHERRQLP